MRLLHVPRLQPRVPLPARAVEVASGAAERGRRHFSLEPLDERRQDRIELRDRGALRRVERAVPSQHVRLRVKVVVEGGQRRERLSAIGWRRKRIAHPQRPLQRVARGVAQQLGAADCCERLYTGAGRHWCQCVERQFADHARVCVVQAALEGLGGLNAAERSQRRRSAVCRRLAPERKVHIAEVQRISRCQLKRGRARVARDR